MLTKKERKILRKYSKATGIEYKFNERVYLRGSPMQRQIDLVAQEATIWLKEKQKKGEIKATKKGKIGKRITNNLIQQFIKEKYGSIKNMPEYFSLDFHEIMKNNPIVKADPVIKKGNLIIEKKAKKYLN